MNDLLPADAYFIGDPAYVLSEYNWQRICRLMTTNPSHYEKGFFELQGRSLFMHGAAYGDDTYKDQDGQEYTVDSGTIGAIPIVLCEPSLLKENENAGQVITFSKPFECSYKEGTFRIGHIIIKTNPQDEVRQEEIREKSGIDAPAGYNKAEAKAWAVGYNTALKELTTVLEPTEEGELEERGFEDTVQYVMECVPEPVRQEFKAFSFDYFFLITPLLAEHQHGLLSIARNQNLSIFEFYELVRKFKLGPNTDKEVNNEREGT